jgi:Ethanolamine utilization protein EutJ (predicted chaperonin)
LDAAEVKVIQKDIWEYFPRFSPQKMASGALWDIFDNQGSRRTWFVGSSVILESVKSVLEYNKLLVSKMTEGMSC